MGEYIDKADFDSFCNELKAATVKIAKKYFPAKAQNADMIYTATISALGLLASTLIQANPSEERRRDATEMFIEAFYDTVTLPRKN